MLQAPSTLDVIQTLELDTHCGLGAFAHVFIPPETFLSLPLTPVGE